MLTAFAATSKSNDHDPYIWLEEVEGKEALARVEASNALELLHPYLRCCHQGLTIFFLCVRGLSKISCNFFFESIYKTTFADSHYLFLGCQSVSEPKEKPLFTIEEVLNAQQQWCDALIEIGEVYAAGEKYHQATASIIKRLYDYDNEKVIFKPTLAYSSFFSYF